MITVVDTGWATTVQDAGRPGLAHLGVPASGALDRRLAALVNRVVGNDEHAAVLETAGGLVVRAERAVLVAVSSHTGPTHLAPGEQLHVAPDPDRAFVYLAVRGGVDVEPVLGSRSHDTLSGIGPRPLQAGSVLAVGPDPERSVVADVAPAPPRRATLRVWPGARLDWFTAEAFEAFCATTWTVGPEVSRIGVRLSGERIERTVHEELPSEGLVDGAVQVTPDGRPVVMLADHPTTGGYPVLAVVHHDDLGDLAQARPGSAVTFVPA